MIMKKLFDRDNFILSSASPRERGKSFILSLLIILLFLFSSFTFFDALYAFADAVGSAVSGSMDVMIKAMLRSVPLFLSFFLSFWGLLLLQALYRCGNSEKACKSAKKDAICLIVFSSTSILYVFLGLAIGKYSSLLEGSPSPLYPLDSVLFSALFLAIGIIVLIYFIKHKDPSAIPLMAHAMPERKLRGLYCTFLAIFTLIALFGFSGGVYSLFIYDFVHGYALYGVALILAYLASPIILCFWEFYYNELTEEGKRNVLLPVSLISLCFSLLIVGFYVIALSTNLDAPSNAGFGMFPVAFAASVNIATLLVVFAPLIFSIVALIKGLLLRRKK